MQEMLQRFSHRGEHICGLGKGKDQTFSDWGKKEGSVNVIMKGQKYANLLFLHRICSTELETQAFHFHAQDEWSEK
jgi:hypothetical protein